MELQSTIFPWESIKTIDKGVFSYKLRYFLSDSLNFSLKIYFSVTSINVPSILTGFPSVSKIKCEFNSTITFSPDCLRAWHV